MSVDSHSKPLAFRESTYLIPTPGLEHRRPPRFVPLILKSWVVIPTALLLIALAIIMEVVLTISDKNYGFHVPPQKTGVFRLASTQFLTSFFPIIFIAPLAVLWQETDFLLKWYQPYVLLCKGNAPVEDSLLLDYIVLGKFFSFFAAIKYKHPLVLASTTTALLAYFLQPSAGAMLQIISVTADQGDTTVTSTRVIGLNPTFATLEAFVSSAGFVQAAVYNGLPDPPFVEGGWAAAEFTFPTDPLVNGSIVVQTTGVQTAPNCVNPDTIQISTPKSGNFTITAGFPGGCNGLIAFDPTASDQQYGVFNVPDCGPPTNVTLQPVVFWFFYVADDGTPQAQSVFCNPSITTSNIIASASLNNGSLTNVTATGSYAPSNNVTGPPLSGQAFNGVVFDNSDDLFVEARAIATRIGVSGAIFRLASQQPNGPASVFSNTTGFLDLTNQVYTQHLSLSAKSVYFIPANTTLVARVTALQPRLFVDALPAHALSIIMFIIGLVGLVVHITHMRVRRNLWLTSPPGSIAAIVSLTSRSGFGDVLLPYDDEATIARKLKGLRFGLDGRTGAIVAEDDGTGPVKLGRDESMMTLLSRDRRRSDPNIPGGDPPKSPSIDLFNPYDNRDP